jgi:acetylglutamate kinase
MTRRISKTFIDSQVSIMPALPLPDVHTRAEVLTQALPHMQRYDQQIVVIKYGGHARGDPEAAEDFAEYVVLLEQSGVKPIIVHGGGPQIGRML